MKTAARWRAGSASDPGLLRTVNEDRVWFDDVRGIFLVVDGLGGHAAGEVAAATAVDVVRQSLRPDVADLESHIRAVICAANNEIFRLAEGNPAWRSMACVMTLAVMQDDHVVIGHVGDSRLYVFWNGKLKKITSDHSPVGEQEDRGLLTEEEAMYHPRRNEVFRDVGSELRLENDDQFIEVRTFLFKDDAALMLCSDGLTDCVTGADISHLLEQFDGDAGRSAQMLVEAANAAGGKDNISVIFVAGPEFAGTDTLQSQDARTRHATTRARTDTRPKKAGRFPRWAQILLITMACAGFGLVLWRIVLPVTAVPVAAVESKDTTDVKHIIEVNASDTRGIIDALSIAVSGQTILVPAGEFLGPLILKEGVDVVAKDPRQTVIRSDPSAPAEQGVVMVARGVTTALVNGLRIISDETHPVKTGVLLADSSVELVNLDISGAVYAGIRIEGNSRPRITECFIHANGGAGVFIGNEGAPTLIRNQIMQNGLMVNGERPGIEIGPTAKPVLEGNLVSGNGADDPLKKPHSDSDRVDGTGVDGHPSRSAHADAKQADIKKRGDH